VVVAIQWRVVNGVYRLIFLLVFCLPLPLIYSFFIFCRGGALGWGWVCWVRLRFPPLFLCSFPIVISPIVGHAVIISPFWAVWDGLLGVVGRRRALRLHPQFIGHRCFWGSWGCLSLTIGLVFQWTAPLAAGIGFFCCLRVRGWSFIMAPFLWCIGIIYKWFAILLLWLFVFPLFKC
jgi:hypothetical protein